MPTAPATSPPRPSDRRPTARRSGAAWSTERSISWPPTTSRIVMLHKVDTGRIQLSAYLGAVGMPGVTAWYGLVRIIAPRAGETVVVSAASGAVGSVVGQLAKVRGARAVGIAGGAEKCAYVENELGFDACVDYKAHRDLKSLSQALKAACPNGIDGHFENVGGTILDAVMLRANAFSRVAMCGMIAGYDGAPIPLGGSTHWRHGSRPPRRHAPRSAV